MRTLTMTGTLALVGACSIALTSAHALPLAQTQVEHQGSIKLVTQERRENEARRGGKSKSQRPGNEEKAEDRGLRYGSRSSSASIPLTTRGTYLYGPSFNGAYMPPSGYSFSGYPIRYADEPAAGDAECASLRRRAMSSGQRSSWDRYYTCIQD
jgi:hypothetical protein